MHSITRLIKNLAPLFLALLLLFSVTSPALAASAEFATVSTEGLKEMLDAKRDFTLIDARTPGEYEDAHIVNAVSIPEKDFDSKLGLLPKDKGALLVFYCNGVRCGKSKKAAAKALGAGYGNILVYAEGMPVWEEKGLPMVTGANYDKKVKTVRIAAKDLETLLKEKGSDYVLVDVREEKEFAEGHIPGAVNIPEASFASRSGGLPKEKGIIVYCNTGRRSALAYKKLIKLAYPSIFEATFVEWKDAKLPIAK